jgi:hypothetical protein
MAAPWPQEATWSSNLQTHAFELTKHLQGVAKYADQNDGLKPQQVARVWQSIYSVLAKVRTAPDLTSINQQIESLRTETDSNLKRMDKAVRHIQEDMKAAKEDLQAGITAGREAKTAAIESIDVGKAVLSIARDIKNKGPQQSAPASYAAVAAQGAMSASIHSPQNARPPAQTQREIIVNIRNPETIQHIRDLDPRNLKAHVEKAIAQSGTISIKVMSVNQLQSGDLSVKTTTPNEMQILRQTAEDWIPRIGNGTSIRSQTYGVLIHSVYTKDIDMNRLEDTIASILAENKPFIPTAEIKYAGWLNRNAPTKAASTLLLEFTKPEDANKIIDEGLVWQGIFHDTERYERQCRLKQCFKCQKYGHIGTQCKAPPACGYCAQNHNSRDCPSRTNQDTPKKCVCCRGTHEAWSSHCPIRKDQLARTKSAYENRPRYHAVLEPPKPTIQGGNPITGMKRQRSTRDLTASQAGRATKQTNTGQATDTVDKENIPPTGRGRPRRLTQPTRKALETRDPNAAFTLESDDDMDTSQE